MLNENLGKECFMKIKKLKLNKYKGKQGNARFSDLNLVCLLDDKLNLKKKEENF